MTTTATTPVSRNASLPSLLLLPPPPQPATRAALSAAYRPSLRSVISRLKSDDDPHGAVLIVALASPVLSGAFRRQKSLSWPEVQSVLAGIYSIISVVSAELQVATDVKGGPGSVDARLVLLDHDPTKKPLLDYKPAIESNNTVVPDLPTFVAAYHPWKYVFSAGNELGLRLRSTYLKMLEGTQRLEQKQIISVAGGLTMNVARPIEPPKTTGGFNVVCLGGTFDHLHPGHKLLLTAAVLLLDVPLDGTSTCVFVVGITGEELLKNKKYAEYVQSWDERAMNVIGFLASILELRKGGWKEGGTPQVTKKAGEITASFRDGSITVQCVEIQDAFGPTITVEHMDALVVSGETRSGGAAVNERRKERGWKPMEVFEVDVLDAEEVTDEPGKAENFASKISSTAIRKQKAEARI